MRCIVYVFLLNILNKDLGTLQLHLNCKAVRDPNILKYPFLSVPLSLIKRL